MTETDIYHLTSGIITVLIFVLLILNMFIRRNFQPRKFKGFVIFMISMIFSSLINMFGYLFDGENYYLSLFLDLGYYITFAISAYLWFLYVTNQILSRKNFIVVALLMLIFPIIAIVLSSIPNLVFTIDYNGVFNRGTYFWLVYSIVIFIVLMPYFILLFHLKQMPYRELLIHFTFPILPVIALILQFIFYGLDIFYITIAISCCMKYIMRQNDYVDTDFLTGLHNRIRLNDFCLKKINKYNKKGYTVVGFMLDINKFKSINDTYGHFEGDIALINAAKILKNSFSTNDALFRYAGDEFIAFKIIKSTHDIEKTLDSIQLEEQKFNENSKTYSISFAVGINIINPNEAFDYEDFLNNVDSSMYESKRNAGR